MRHNVTCKHAAQRASMQSLWHREQEMIGDDASDSVMKGVVTASVYEAERGMYAYSRIAPVYGEPQ